VTNNITENGSNKSLLEVNDLVKEYPLAGSGFRRKKLRAVDYVSFVAKPGETLAVVGESGSGKSTIGRCVLNLTSTTQGAIHFRGEKIDNLNERAYKRFRQHLQIVFQSPISSFNPRMKVGEAIKEPLQLRDDLKKADYEAEAIRLLAQVGLEERFLERYPAQMSGGQLQRVGVARALAPRPDLVFLDEPTSALDLSIRGQIVNLLLEQQQKLSLSFILVTHDLRVVEFMADRIAVMYLGQFVEEASGEAIFDQPLHPYTRGLFAAVMIGEDEEQREQRRKLQLRGEVLRLEPGYKGCRLVRRCPFARDGCEAEQTLRQVKPGHWVRCWRAEEVEQELQNTELSEIKDMFAPDQAHDP
jgi:oligopeptide/dipeptide ABC transporter ATP-binding protein